MAQKTHSKTIGLPEGDDLSLILFILGLFVVGAGLMMILPKWKAIDAAVSIEQVSAAPQQSGFAVQAVIKWAAPWKGSCYLANDVRPKGAPKGTPETLEWDSNHLIRYSVVSGRPFVEKWINIEIVNQNENTATFTYLIDPPAGKALDFYSDLYCDNEDKPKASASKSLTLP